MKHFYLPFEKEKSNQKANLSVSGVRALVTGLVCFFVMIALPGYGQSVVVVFSENFDNATSTQPWPYSNTGWFRSGPLNTLEYFSGQGKALKVNFPQGTVGTDHGLGNYRIPLDSSYKELYLSWEYLVSSNFDYGWADRQGGGKFFGGFAGGSMTAIPNIDTTDYDGWVSIFMFQNGTYTTYNYFKGSSFSGGWPLGDHVAGIVKGQWRRITIRLKINDGDLYNGLFEVFDNDVLVYQLLNAKIVNRFHPEYLIEHIYLNSFFGGSGDGYRSPIDQYMAFDNITAFYYPVGSTGYRSGPSEKGRTIQVPQASAKYPKPPNKFTPITYTDASGVIESHCGFYHPVNHVETSETAVIQVSGATSLKLNVTKFKYDAGVNYLGYKQILKIYQGTGSGKVLVKTYQKGIYTTPGTVTINGNSATLEWQAGAGNHNGFTIQYTSNGTGSGKNFTCGDFYARQAPVGPITRVTSIEVTGAYGATSINTAGGTLQLNAAVLPDNATDKTVKWSVENGTGQAAISINGLVTAVRNGTVTAKASANDGSGISGSLPLTLTNQKTPVSGISVTGAGGATAITTDEGTLQMNAEVSPADASNKSITWSVINGTGQATISATGLVTAVKNGTVTVKALANDGSGVSGTLSLTLSNQIIPVESIMVAGIWGLTTVKEGNKLQLVTRVLPSDATDSSLIWSIEGGTGQATISETGKITATTSGTVIAKATATDGSGVSGTMTVSIVSQNIPVTGLSVAGNEGATSVSQGSTLQITALITPVNATDKSVTWSVTNGTGQASIDASGLLSAEKSGSVTVKATANDGSGVSGTLAITITPPKIAVTGIEVGMEGGITSISESESLQLTAVVSPANATEKSVTWSVLKGTGNASISATGLITALSRGSVTAKASANDGSGVSGMLDLEIESAKSKAEESRLVYIDPTNQSDALQDGSITHPFGSWKNVAWRDGYSYLQKKGTVSAETKIHVAANNVIIGSYGEGDQPVIQSDVNDFVFRAYEKTGLTFQDVHIIAPNAVSCIYVFGENSDSLCVENCTMENSVNGVRILAGNNVVIRYNTFVNCNEAIYCYANDSQIYYNIFRENDVAVNMLGNLSTSDIFNNVFYDNAVGISNTYTELTLYNNIFYMINAGDIAINNKLNKLISDNNIFFPEQQGFIQMNNKTYNTLVEFQQDYNIDLKSFTEDPMFVDIYNRNFALDPSSPAINKGKTVGLTQDYYGTAVPLGGVPDIGISEITSVAGPQTGFMDHQQDEVSDEFQVYPNPCMGVFNVAIKNQNAGSSRIFIQDLSGKTVFESQFSGTNGSVQEVDVSRLYKGVYIVSVDDNSRIMSQPIIIR